MQVRRMDPFANRNTAYGAPEVGNAGQRFESRNERSVPDGGTLSKFNIKNFKTDDWILLAIIGTLILEGSRDYVLLCALGYLFIMGL